MKILEARDGFIKFEADKSINLSSFIKADGMGKSYIAQVIQLKRSGENSIAYAKILFLYIADAIENYDKTLPSKEAEITEFSEEILKNAIYAKNPVIAGKTLQSIPITIDAGAFDKKMLISVDDSSANNILARNLTKQFNNLSKNVIIIDTLGVIKAKKVKAGVDFKLPLNTESLAFMYQDCLNDATSESKATIIEIFKELAEYSKTVPFLPFEALKTIVDDMVDKAHVFKLLVLKNKLAKFDRLGYFAKNQQEVKSLENCFKSKCTVIDLSELDTVFQNRYLEHIYETLDKFSDTQVFLEMSNSVSKKSIKNILSNQNISTTFITHSRFKYLNDIKNVFDNFIIFPSLTNNEVFNIYSTFIKAMKPSSYLIAGEATSYIPLVSSLEIIDELPVIDIDINIETNETDDSALEQLAAENTEEADVIEQALEPEQNLPDCEEEDIVNADVSEEEQEETEAANTEDEQSSLPEKDTEILANIEEQSINAMQQAGEDLTPPENLNLFDTAEEIITDNEVETIEENKDEEAVIAEENTVEDNSADVLQEILDEPESIQNNEDAEEEIPLTESFETEIHPSSEEEYSVLEDAPNDYEEITLNQEIEEIPLAEELPTEEELEALPAVVPSETEDTLEIVDADNEEEIDSIELDSDMDLELDSEPVIDEQILPEEAAEEEPKQKTEILPISGNDNFDLDEIVELDPDEADENDIVIDMSEELEETELTEEDLDTQIVKDVDKVFTTRKDDDISDSDLDFIDELNNDDEILLEEVSDNDAVLEEISDSSESNEGILEAPEEPIELQEASPAQEILETRNSSTPIVPVYDADIPQEDLVMSDPIQQGDTVTHAKYGTGVVEKMIKYGNKTLFSINFDNIGRRLLDPTLTEIKKS